MLNKAISTPIAISIILVLAVAVGSFTWWQYGETWKEASELPEVELPEKDEVADWKIYRNEEYGFEIKFSQNWTLEIKKPYDLCQAGPGYSCLASIQFSPPLSLAGVDYLDISLIILSNPEKYSTREYLKEYTPEILEDPQLSLLEDVTIGGEKGVKMVFTTGIVTYRQEINYSVAKRENFFGLGTQVTGEVEKTEEVLNQMLSTFKFLD